MPQDGPHPELSPVPLNMYNTLTFLDCAVKNTSSQFVLNALSEEGMGLHPTSIADYDHCHHIMLSSYQQPVAKFARISWLFDFQNNNGRWKDTVEHILLVKVAHGSTYQFPLRLGIFDYRIKCLTFWFHSEGFSLRLDHAWLSQAIHVFTVLGTPREEWEGYTLFKSGLIFLDLDPDIDDTQLTSHHPWCVDTQIDPLYYLFVLPPPQLPDMTPDVAAWLWAPAESLYYWSLDPTGDSRMPEAQCVALGLPRFCKINNLPFPAHWKAEVYDLVRQWQEAQGFDPTTTDFARSMGYPILEILPQSANRLEDCVKSDEGEHSHSSLPNNSRPKGVHLVSMLVDSKPKPVLGGMEVDECFETSPNTRDASFAQEWLEESSSMDVDMED
ncbi:hypothetical protein AAF712_014323 [Marasmius tenuissimus]|uniref:Uncharacterized protein n=1 Tax=Marasmius tenuissimus TaxID=585030 RepID=A0ABR2ZBD0_9AGAR